jgi:hypothetical protein
VKVSKLAELAIFLTLNHERLHYDDSDGKQRQTVAL